MKAIQFCGAIAIAAVVSLVTMQAQYDAAPVPLPGQAPAGGRGAAPRGAQQPNVPAPRTADGHPDLSGMWGGGEGMGSWSMWGGWTGR